MIASLEVGSWPIISWSAQKLHRLDWVHLESLMHRAQATSGIWAGATGRSLWGGMSAIGMVGLSWQWAQIAPGVVAMTDPMAIDTNLALLGSDGSRLSASASAMELNRIVASLGWQPEAMRAIRQRPARRIHAVQTHATLHAS